MIPRLLFGDPVSVTKSDTVFSGDLTVTPPVVSKLSYFDNLSLFKLVEPVAFSRKMNIEVPTFNTHVHNVVPLGSTEKVCGSDTERIIAFMEHLKTWWNFPIRQYPHRPVSVNQFPVTTCDLTVSEATSSPQPNPTFSKFWIAFRDCAGFFNYRSPQTPLKVFGKMLRKRVIAFSLVLHKSVVLICATLSGVSAPRGHFHFVDFDRICQVFGPRRHLKMQPI